MYKHTKKKDYIDLGMRHDSNVMTVPSKGLL